MGTGLVTIRISLSLTAAAKATFEQEFKTDTPKFCQPRSYCAPDEDDDTKCVCAPDTDCKDPNVCRWAVKDIDCPIDGCFAFGITMPGRFSTGIANTPPVPSEFSKDMSYNWSLPFFEVNKNVSGAQCNYQGER